MIVGDLEPEICYYDAHDWIYVEEDSDEVEEVIIYHVEDIGDLIIDGNVKVKLEKAIEQKPLIDKKMVIVSIALFVSTLLITCASSEAWDRARIVDK